MPTVGEKLALEWRRAPEGVYRRPLTPERKARATVQLQYLKEGKKTPLGLKTLWAVEEAQPITEALLLPGWSFLKAIRGVVGAVEPRTTFWKTALSSAKRGILSPERVGPVGEAMQQAYPGMPWQVSGLVGTIAEIGTLFGPEYARGIVSRAIKAKTDADLTPVVDQLYNLKTRALVNRKTITPEMAVNPKFEATGKGMIMDLLKSLRGAEKKALNKVVKASKEAIKISRAMRSQVNFYSGLPIKKGVTIRLKSGAEGKVTSIKEGMVTYKIGTKLLRTAVGRVAEVVSKGVSKTEELKSMINQAKPEELKALLEGWEFVDKTDIPRKDVRKLWKLLEKKVEEKPPITAEETTRVEERLGQLRVELESRGEESNLIDFMKSKGMYLRPYKGKKELEEFRTHVPRELHKKEGQAPDDVASQLGFEGDQALYKALDMAREARLRIKGMKAEVRGIETDRRKKIRSIKEGITALDKVLSTERNPEVLRVALQKMREQFARVPEEAKEYFKERIFDKYERRLTLLKLAEQRRPKAVAQNMQEIFSIRKDNVSMAKLPREEHDLLLKDYQARIGPILPAQFEKLKVGELKKIFTPMQPPPFKEISEADIKGPGGEVKLTSYIANQLTVFIKDLKAPGIWYAIDDAYFYSKWGDETAIGHWELTKQLDNHLVSIFGKLPKEGSKESARVYELLNGNVSPGSQAEISLLDWWQKLTPQLHHQINLARAEDGLEPIHQVENYLHRRLTRDAKLYIDKLIEDTAHPEDLPRDVQKIMTYVPPRRKIPMVFERSIEDPNSVLEAVNNLRIEEGKPPLDTLYVKDGVRLARLVLRQETLYPRLVRGLKKSGELRNQLVVNAETPKIAEGIQRYVDNWLKYQVLNRTPVADDIFNRKLGLDKINTFLKKNAGFDLGANPIRTIAGAWAMLVHTGGVWLNFALGGLNSLQVIHNIGMFGPVAHAAGEMAFFNVNPSARRLLKYSRIWTDRYAFENPDDLPLTIMYKLPGFAYLAADMHNVGTAVLDATYRYFKNDPAILKMGKGKGPMKVYNGLLNIIEGKNTKLRHAYLEEMKINVDYPSFVAQFPYFRRAMQPIVQTAAGRAAETFQSWWQNYWTAYMPELTQRLFTGKDSLGNPVDVGQRLGLLYHLILVGTILGSAKRVNEEMYDYLRRILPWRVFTARPSPQVAMLSAVMKIGLGFALQDGRTFQGGLKDAFRASRVHVPGRIFERTERWKETWENIQYGRKRKAGQKQRLELLQKYRDLLIQKKQLEAQRAR